MCARGGAQMWRAGWSADVRRDGAQLCARMERRCARRDGAQMCARDGSADVRRACGAQMCAGVSADVRRGVERRCARGAELQMCARGWKARCVSLAPLVFTFQPGDRIQSLSICRVGSASIRARRTRPRASEGISAPSRRSPPRSGTSAPCSSSSVTERTALAAAARLRAGQRAGGFDAPASHPRVPLRSSFGDSRLDPGGRLRRLHRAGSGGLSSRHDLRRLKLPTRHAKKDDPSQSGGLTMPRIIIAAFLVSFGAASQPFTPTCRNPSYPAPPPAISLPIDAVCPITGQPNQSAAETAQNSAKNNFCAPGPRRQSRSIRCAHSRPACRQIRRSISEGACTLSRRGPGRPGTGPYSPIW